MLVADPAARLEALTEALSCDPDSPLLQRTLREEMRNAFPAPADYRRLLELAEAHPDKPALVLTVLNASRSDLPEADAEAAERARRRLALSRKLAQQLSDRSGDSEQLLNALLNYGILACSLDRIDAAEAFWQKLVRRIDPGAGIAERQRDAVILESGAMFCVDAAQVSDSRREWFGLADSPRQRLAETGSAWLELLAAYDDLPLSDAAARRRLTTFTTLGRNDRAEEFSRRRVETSGGEREARRLLAETLAGMGRGADARKVYELLAADWPEDAAVQQELAELLQTQADWPAALPVWRRLARLRPGDSIALFGLARALNGVGDYAGTADLLKLLPAHEPETALLGLAALRKLARFDEAGRLARSVTIAEDGELRVPRHPAVARELGQELLQLAEASGDPGLARLTLAYYRKSNLDDSPELCFRVGSLLTDLDIELDDAGKLLRRALRNRPGRAEEQAALAWWHYRRGEYAKAWEWMLHSLGRLPASEAAFWDIFERAGEILRRLGETAAADAFAACAADRDRQSADHLIVNIRSKP